jgi:chitodextrinase
LKGQQGTFWAQATDPDGNEIQYRFDWNAAGCHCYSDWTELVDSGQELSMLHSWGKTGTYVVKVQARDEHGAISVWSNGLTVIVTVNHSPNKPHRPTGPTALLKGQQGTFWAQATDPDGDEIQYRFDWNAAGCHCYSDWTELVDSGQELSMLHSWGKAGTYVVKVQARDEHGAISVWSNGLTVIVTVNHSPNKPHRPTGPTVLLKGQQGTFWAQATDPDGDEIQYRFDWNAAGCHCYSDWTELVDSGQELSMLHSWGKAGTYVVKVQARDEHGAISVWSNGLTVTVSI